MADIGSFAGNFLQSFAAARNNKGVREREEKIAKQTAQLIEQRLALGQIEIDNKTTLAELLVGRTQQEPSRTMALESVTGPPTPLEIPGELSTESPANVLTRILSEPEGLMSLAQTGKLGEFSEAAEIGAQGDFASMLGEFEPGTNIAEQLRTPEVAEARFRATGDLPEDTEIRDLLDVMNLRMQEMSLQRQAFEDQLTIRDLNREQRREELDIDTSIGSISALIDDNNVLRGTFLETGLPFPEGRNLLYSTWEFLNRSVGRDTAEMRKARVAYGNFSKRTAGLSIAMMNSMEDAGVSVAEFAAIRESLANENIPPDTNDTILVGLLERTISNADILGYTPQEIQQAQELIEQTKARLAGGGGGETIRFDAQGNRR